MSTPTHKRPSLAPPPGAAAAGGESERSEPKPAAAAPGGGVPSPEVLAQPTRRQFSAEYKQRILAECDAARELGQIGRILRREGLWSSHLRDWRAARDRGAKAALAPKARGPKARRPSPEQLEITRLQRENARLQKRLEKAELVIDFQKKVSALLGIALPAIEGHSDGSES